MSFEVQHNGAVVIVGDYDEESKEIGIEDVVNPETGEVLTDEWFESGNIYDPDLRDKIQEKGREGMIDDFLNQI